MQRRVIALLLGAVLACGVSACKHDLDALQSEIDQNAPLRGGSSAAGRGSAGRSSAAGSAGAEAGAGGSTEPPAAACEPCERLTPAASQLGLHSCCRGVTNEDCGLTFREDGVCLPRMIPGQLDDACEGASSGGMRLDGCCRPDGRCGLAGSALGLGCVAKDELPAALGGSTEPAYCSYECEADTDCNEVLPGLRCVENAARDGRYCAVECERNQDCSRKGEVCAFANDVGMDRVVAICREPVGDAEPGDFCSAATDCVHGVCLRIGTTAPAYCSQLCKNKPDCPSDATACIRSNIPSPVTQRLQPFSICRK